MYLTKNSQLGSKSLVVKNSIRNSNRGNIVLYSVNLDVFSIAIEFLTTNDLDSGRVLDVFLQRVGTARGKNL